jgi:capsular exopolysaccharide synthesis family protein
VSKPIQSLLVTSAGPGEGKSTTAANLAVAMAQGDRRVVLLDADMRRPGVHRVLHIQNQSGLSDIFRRQMNSVSALAGWGKPPLGVITSGPLPPNPVELLDSGRMDEILEELEAHADIVIIDSPPFVVSDPIVLSAKVDAVLLVVHPGKTRTPSAQAMLEQLQRAGARVVGVALNPISRRRSSYYGKYRYYSEYYSRGYGYELSANGKNGHKRNLKPEFLRKLVRPSTGKEPEAGLEI